MTKRTETRPLAPTRTLPRLRVATLDDYPAIMRLKESNGLANLPARDWAALCLNNPLRRRLKQGWPVGWVLEVEDGRIVGSLANFPSLYTFRGDELLAANGHAWVVDPEYRGTALWLMDEYFNQEGIDLFVNNTVNARAENPFGAFGSERVPAGDWNQAVYFVAAYQGFAGAALRSKRVPRAGLFAVPVAAGLRLKHTVMAPRLPAPAPSVDVEIVDHFDQRFDTFWAELVRLHPDKLLGTRDRETLAWHYAGLLRAGAAWVVTASRGGLLRAYVILKRQDSPLSGLRRMRLADYQTLEPEKDLLPGLLRIALRRCAAEGIHTLEQIGVGLPKLRGFDQCAPSRRTLPSWPFYYKATDPVLDASLKDPTVWDPSAFDGDASIQ